MPLDDIGVNVSNLAGSKAFYTEAPLRPLYHEHYDGAFVHDPDGANVEAVCHAPAASSAA
jgi:hypothetical protein